MTGDTIKTLSFPGAGIDVSAAFCRQKARQIIGQSGGLQPQPTGSAPILGGYDLNAQQDPHMWAQSTPRGINVRGFDPVANRRRGGSRAGLSRYNPVQPSGMNLIQNLNYMTETPGMQTNSSGRVVTLVAVSQGNVYDMNAGDTVWDVPANNTIGPVNPPLNYTGVIFSAVQNQIMFFADGVHWVLYSPLGGVINSTAQGYTGGVYAADSVNTWTLSTSDLLGNAYPMGGNNLPVDSANNTPRLICNWRQRIVVAGLLLSPQDVFMSAQGDPTNWCYSPTYTTPTQAVALDASAPAGQVGDVVTALVPYTNDILVIGGDHSIYYLNGDPMNGGQMDLISDSIGMAFGNSWCKDPYGNIYFVSNKTGIYTLVPGQAPQRISQQVEQLLANIDTGLNTISLLWNDRFQGLNVFITPTQGVTQYVVQDNSVAQQPVTHFFYEQRTGAWWQDRFANPNHNPLTCVTFDGNTPDDRVPLIGSWDGFVRSIDPFATLDDGWPIASSVILGPILTQDFDDMLLYELQGILGEGSGNVTYNIYVGSTAEKALSSQPVATGTFAPGRNYTSYVRKAGHAIYIEIVAQSPWQLEGIRCRIAGSGLGKVRRRAGKY